MDEIFSVMVVDYYYVIIKVINCGFNETIKLRAKCVNNGKDSRWFSVEREEINVSHGKFMLKGIIFF